MARLHDNILAFAEARLKGLPKPPWAYMNVSVAPNQMLCIIVAFLGFKHWSGGCFDVRELREGASLGALVDRAIRDATRGYVDAMVAKQRSRYPLAGAA